MQQPPTPNPPNLAKPTDAAPRTAIVTGCAGFIGMHCAERLLAQGWRVAGIDSLNAYYDVALKHARLARLRAQPHFSFTRADVADAAAVHALFAAHRPQRVLHLAAQAGVRHCIEQPADYTSANLLGFANVLQACRTHGVEHLVFASSSSVYGGNAKTPFAECDAADHPVSYYAATKRANELMAHSYAHLYGLPCTGLRFFTVYGPWGRPDMALFKFTRAMLAGQTIDVYGHGEPLRDFTYIDDIAEGVLRVLDKPACALAGGEAAAHTPAASALAPYRVFNIGGGAPVRVLDCIAALEAALGVRARMNFLPMQAGDMRATAADTRALQAWTGFVPATPVAEGVARFARWYQEFHKP